MNKISVNGNVITGDFNFGNGYNVTSEGDQIIINGKVVATTQEKNITVIIEGDVTGDVETQSGSVTVHGNTGDVRTMSGSVRIDGKIVGDVETMSGSVTAGTIVGSVESMSGSIRTR